MFKQGGTGNASTRRNKIGSCNNNNEPDQFRAQQAKFKNKLEELHTMGGEIEKLKNENQRT